MSNKQDRDTKEMQNLFGDPKFSRQAWRSVGNAILRNPASTPIVSYDKDGNVSYLSELESYSYSKLKNDIESLGKENRNPTELEMILQCQILKARHDTSAATFIRDTLGAKPVDESKIDASVRNPYESLTDEELEMLDSMRKQKDEQISENKTI